MKKNTYEDRHKYIKMIEQGYSINYICKHHGISHKDLEALWHKYQKDGSSGLVKKELRLKDGKAREMILREIDAKCLTLHLAAAKYDVSVNTIIRWRRIVEKGGYEALYRGLSETYSAILMGRPKKKKLEEMTELERALYIRPT